MMLLTTLAGDTSRRSLARGERVLQALAGRGDDPLPQAVLPARGRARDDAQEPAEHGGDRPRGGVLRLRMAGSAREARADRQGAAGHVAADGEARRVRLRGARARDPAGVRPRRAVEGAGRGGGPEDLRRQADAP